MAEYTNAASTIGAIFNELVGLQKSNLEMSRTIIRMLSDGDTQLVVIDLLNSLQDSQKSMAKKLDETLHLVREMIDG